MNVSASLASRRSSKRGLHYSRQRLDARDSSRNSSKVSVQSEKESTYGKEAASVSEDLSSYDDLAVFARLLSDKEMGAQIEFPKLPPLVEQKVLKQKGAANVEKQTGGKNEQQDEEKTNDGESTDLDTLETSLNPETVDHPSKHNETDFVGPDLPDLEENLTPSEIQ